MNGLIWVTEILRLDITLHNRLHGGKYYVWQDFRVVVYWVDEGDWAAEYLGMVVCYRSHEAG